mmetsp:Transcript_27516/g.73287  ORF Transcript_27516/g.73287 Transcript_27516/m.73287 type:complete len:276 (-) Transcript_27516:104-931(-)
MGSGVPLAGLDGPHDHPIHGQQHEDCRADDRGSQQDPPPPLQAALRALRRISTGSARRRLCTLLLLLLRRRRRRRGGTRGRCNRSAKGRGALPGNDGGGGGGEAHDNRRVGRQDAMTPGKLGVEQDLVLESAPHRGDFAKAAVVLGPEERGLALNRRPLAAQLGRDEHEALDGPTGQGGDFAGEASTPRLPHQQRQRLGSAASAAGPTGQVQQGRKQRRDGGGRGQCVEVRQENVETFLPQRNRGAVPFVEDPIPHRAMQADGHPAAARAELADL